MMESDTFSPQGLSVVFENPGSDLPTGSVPGYRNPGNPFPTGSENHQYLVSQQEFEMIFPNPDSDQPAVLNLGFEDPGCHLSIGSGSYQYPISPPSQNHLPQVFECAPSWEDDLREIANAYELLNPIGTGSYGYVFRGRDRHTGEMVAMKRVRKDDETTWSEIEGLVSCSHPSIIGFREVVLADYVFIVMELAVRDLNSLVLNKKQPIDENRARNYIRQLLEGVAHLHNNGIIHRDLKTMNLLLTNNDQLKICDFGGSRRCRFDDDGGGHFDVHHLCYYTLEVGTPGYIAPEILYQILYPGEEEEESVSTGEYSAAGDMWSVGCILAELVCRKQLFWAASDFDQLLKIMELVPSGNQVQDYYMLRQRIPPESLSAQGFDLLIKLLAFDAEKRISANDALSHPWFSH